MKYISESLTTSIGECQRRTPLTTKFVRQRNSKMFELQNFALFRFFMLDRLDFSYSWHNVYSLDFLKHLANESCLHNTYSHLVVQLLTTNNQSKDNCCGILFYASCTHYVENVWTWSVSEKRVKNCQNLCSFLGIITC